MNRPVDCHASLQRREKLRRSLDKLLAQTFQDPGVRCRTIIEANPHSMADHYEPWQKQFPGRNIRRFDGRWQDELDDYDSGFSHAFPLNEAEFVDYIVNSVTFAEHFFPTAAKLLRDGGVFTYLTTEIDSMSRRHQRSLFRYFREVRMNVESLSIPQDTKQLLVGRFNGHFVRREVAAVFMPGAGKTCFGNESENLR